MATEIVSFPMKNPQKSCHYRPFVHVPSMLRWSLWYWGKFTSLFGKPIGFPFWENSLVVEPTPPKNDGVNVSWDEDIIGKKIQSCSSHHQPEKLLIIGLFILYVSTEG